MQQSTCKIKMPVGKANLGLDSVKYKFIALFVTTTDKYYRVFQKTCNNLYPLLKLCFSQDKLKFYIKLKIIKTIIIHFR